MKVLKIADKAVRKGKASTKRIVHKRKRAMSRFTARKVQKGKAGTRRIVHGRKRAVASTAARSVRKGKAGFAAKAVRGEKKIGNIARSTIKRLKP